MSTYPEPAMQRQLELEDDQQRMLTRERRWHWTIFATIAAICVLALFLGGCAEARWLAKCSVTRSLGCS